jgi:hypothetical protein
MLSGDIWLIASGIRPRCIIASAAYICPRKLYKIQSVTVCKHEADGFCFHMFFQKHTLYMPVDFVFVELAKL